MKFLRNLLLLAVLAAVGAAAAAMWWLDQPLELASNSIEVSIEPKTAPRDVALAWVQAGVQANPLLLYEWFRWSGQARKIRAGSYEIERGVTPRALLDKMVRGDEVMATVRLIEGWTFRQFRVELAKAPDLKQTTASLSEAELMNAIGAPRIAAEGRFYPDTYAFSKGASDVAVL
ncbi:MAG TPA: endolytic transglycosylase MltG, partial [Rhizobacter sp.]|nr:endolytic transglycosylase MltG [Rhizobacter sp.]